MRFLSALLFLLFIQPAFCNEGGSAHGLGPQSTEGVRLANQEPSTPAPAAQEPAKAPTALEDFMPPVVPTKPTFLPTVKRDEWINRVLNDLPSRLCTAESDHARCYTLEPGECELFTKVFLQACFNTLLDQMPETFDTKAGENYGALASRCAHDVYEKFLLEKRIESTECPKVNSSIATQNPAAKPEALEFADPTQPETQAP